MFAALTSGCWGWTGGGELFLSDESVEQRFALVRRDEKICRGSPGDGEDEGERGVDRDVCDMIRTGLPCGWVVLTNDDKLELEAARGVEKGARYMGGDPDIAGGPRARDCAGEVPLAEGGGGADEDEAIAVGDAVAHAKLHGLGRVGRDGGRGTGGVEGRGGAGGMREGEARRVSRDR